MAKESSWADFLFVADEVVCFFRRKAFILLAFHFFRIIPSFQLFFVPCGGG